MCVNTGGTSAPQTGGGRLALLKQGVEILPGVRKFNLARALADTPKGRVSINGSGANVSESFRGCFGAVMLEHVPARETIWYETEKEVTIREVVSIMKGAPESPEDISINLAQLFPLLACLPSRGRCGATKVGFVIVNDQLRMVFSRESIVSQTIYCCSVEGCADSFLSKGTLVFGGFP